MSNPNRMPPPEIQRAAGQVQGWLDQQSATLKSPDEIAKMTPAEPWTTRGCGINPKCPPGAIRAVERSAPWLSAPSSPVV
jgi:hypothetical protein